MISSALAQTSNLVFLDGIASQRENSGCAIEKAVAGQRRIQGGEIHELKHFRIFFFPRGSSIRERKAVSRALQVFNIKPSR